MLTNPGGTNELTQAIIGCAIEVHRECGPGLLESAYKTCMAVELAARSLLFELERPVPLVYKGVRLDIGYRLDLIVEEKVIVDLKSVASLAPIHTAQVLTYLRLTKTPVALIINFNVPVLKQGVRRVLNSERLRESAMSDGGDGDDGDGSQTEKRGNGENADY